MSDPTAAPTGVDGEPAEAAITWNGIFVPMAIACIQSIVFYSFFAYQRGKDSQSKSFALYEPRQFTRSHRSPTPFAEGSWWKNAWNVTQEDLLKQVGLDSFMFLRFLRLCVRIAAVGSLCAIFMIPTYATGKSRGDSTIEFNSLTLARVDPNSTRIWAAVVGWWYFIAFLLYELVQEWKLYAQNRTEFLAKGDPDTDPDFRYAVRVEQLPPSLRSSTALSTYFERIFPGKVRQATVYLKIPDLEKLIAERQTAIETVEQAVAFQKANPEKPAPASKIGGLCCFGGNMVETIPHFSSEIERLNQDIDQVRAATVKQSSATAVSDDQDVPGVPSSTGVVSFTSLRAKQAAVQCQLSDKVDNVTVFPAADPEGVVWPNVCVPLTRQRVCEKQASALWIVGVLFWAIPVAFVVSLANLNSLLTTFKLPTVNSAAGWYGIVAGLLPVIFLAILMMVLYMAIVAAATHWIGYKSLPEVDAYTLRWHQMFQFANLFLVLFSGSLFGQLETVLDGDFKEVIRILAKALPGASVFFVNMMSVGGLGAYGLQLSMLPTYGVTFVMNMLKPESARTQRMLDDAKKPPSILWGKVIPPLVFVFLVMVLYMPIVPLMEIFALIYFSGHYLVMKHQCLHVYSQTFEGGGLTTWQTLFTFLMVAIYISELVFISYMGIKEAPAQAACGVVPLVITILVHLIVINRNIVTPLKNLSLEKAADVDIADGELQLEQNYTIDDQLYGQPALKTAEEERKPLPYRRSAETTSEKAERGTYYKEDGEEVDEA